MSYNISSDRLRNPLLKELLKALTDFFNSIGSEFYIIGATARDIVMAGIHDQHPGRETVDLDIAIAIPDWNRYHEISKKLCQKDHFTKSKEQKQRFWYKALYMIDMVPFGDVAKENQRILWPPEETHVMSVIGFTQVAKHTLSVDIDGEITIRIASLPGIFLLKIAAWHDRKLKTNKDAEDMAFLISVYLDLNMERAAASHYDVFEREPFSSFSAGASLLGRDMKSVIHDDLIILNEITGILQRELDSEEGSLLINQILETHSYLKYEEVYDALNE